MSESVVRNPTSRRYHAQLHGLCGRFLYPPVGRRPGRPDQPVSLSDVAELERLVSAALSSGCTGTILGLLPFPSRTWRLGSSPTSDRSRTSRASASEILRPARHSIRNSSLALGFGAVRIRASTWWASRYSGSFLEGLLRPSGSLGFGCWPLGLRLRGTTACRVVMGGPGRI